jgi:hypothetical protein
MEALGQPRMVDREVLRRESSTTSRDDVRVCYRTQNLSVALVCWAHSGGISATSTALERPGETRGDLCMKQL